MNLYQFDRFKKLSTEKQLDQLSLHGIDLDLCYRINGTEAVLFAYRDFYVELVVERYTDDIISVHCFRNGRKLNPFLQLININSIRALLACGK